LLAPEIPVFKTKWVQEHGVQKFLDEQGVSIIETHSIGFDKWLFAHCNDIRTPYVVCHHGSYEVIATRDEEIRWLLATVDHWVYLAEKNLDFLRGYTYDAKAFTKLRNAMPVRHDAFALSREEMGIPADAFVFGLASRAVREKGWDVAIRGLRHARARSDRPVHLLLCGDGEELDTWKAIYGNDPGVCLLGFQENIQGFYRLCDCCILPSRFRGETFPRTLVEALMAGVPAIATDLGEVHSILQIDREPFGVLVPPIADDAAFDIAITNAMLQMLDKGQYEGFRGAVAKHGYPYSMDDLATDYLAIYQKVLAAPRRT
jgi:glycosyltransferase involved in cell wall biosynthesis